MVRPSIYLDLLSCAPSPIENTESDLCDAGQGIYLWLQWSLLSRWRRWRRLVKKQGVQASLLTLASVLAPLDVGSDIDATAIVSSSLTWRSVNVDGADLRWGSRGELRAQIYREMVVDPWRSVQGGGGLEVDLQVCRLGWCTG
jgi:hypothetical protein